MTKSFVSINDIHPSFRRMLEQHNIFNFVNAYENYEQSSGMSARSLLVLERTRLSQAFLIDETPSSINGRPYRDVLSTTISFSQSRGKYLLRIEISGERSSWNCFFDTEEEAKKCKELIDKQR